jgi:hypothetical protein
MRSAVILNGDGPETKPRRLWWTEGVLASARSNRAKILLSTNFISNWANAIPMQRRIPPPNGKNSKGEKCLNKNLLGSNCSGSG